MGDYRPGAGGGQIFSGVGKIAELPFLDEHYQVSPFLDAINFYHR